MATRILVVDDSPTIRTVVSGILARSGYEATSAPDGHDAYEALASGEVKADLVLVDFVMPRMNGYQFCRALRDNAELAAMPVVLMSAKADRIRDQFVQQTGALDAITKPFDARALVAVIENALRKVNTHRVSSARLPDFESDEVTSAGDLRSSAVLEYETQRTHVVQIVADKLASIAASAIAEHPDAVGSPAFARSLGDRLSNEAILEMMEAIGERRRDRSGTLLEGDLGAVPIGAILQLLQSENQTGTLVCRNGSTEVRAAFREGAIDLVQSTGAGDEFRLGRFFVEEGVLTPKEIDEITRRNPRARTSGPILLEEPEAPRSSIQMREGQGPDTLSWSRRPSAIPPTEPSIEAASEDLHGVVTLPGNAIMDALAAATQKPRPLGMALLAAGKIVESQLRTALTRQSSELLYEVLRWPAGRFELRREPPSELAESAKLGLPVASVVMEGFRRVDEWRVLERTLGSFDAVLLRDDAAFGKLDVGSLPPKEKVVLDAVDGERTVRAVVLASNLSSFDACRVLVQFLEARVLRRRAS